MAEREVRLGRAKWLGASKIRLRFDPFAYRYIRLKVLSRDGHICYWCGGFGNTMDHVIPWSKGGRTAMNNCICACEECNGERADMPADEFAKLRNVPPPRPEGGPPPVRLAQVISLNAGQGKLGGTEASASAAGGAVAAAVAAPAAAMSPAPPSVAARPEAALPAPVARPRLVPRRRPMGLAELLDPYLAPLSARLFY